MGACISHSLEDNPPVKSNDLKLPKGGEAAIQRSQTPVPRSSEKVKPRSEIEDQIDLRFRSFKQFDTVLDHSDHHFSNAQLVKEVPERTKVWTKRILHEWKILEKNLPETIFVRVYEKRMDILRAAIIGPAGTPYHDGLFFFDICFPRDYPSCPPLVHYQSHGLQLNPNLYGCGAVCLSLLNTWYGSGCEKWNPKQSTMLQVLVSFQALILNTRPYFNEPGYSPLANTWLGERKSIAYNKDAFVLSCKAMLYTLRTPPKHFEYFVAGHFRKQGRTILRACQAYMAGAQVGCNIEAWWLLAVNSNETWLSSYNQLLENILPSSFKTQLKDLFEHLVKEFTAKGVNCAEFLPQEVKAGDAASTSDIA